MDAFEQLILVAESQPSNGTVRKFYPPNGETNFAFAYGGKRDNDLRDVLVGFSIRSALLGVLRLILALEEHSR